MELTNTHLRYLLTIYQLSQVRLEVRSASVAEALGVSRPSVARMLAILSEKELVTKEYYGRVTLTDQGAALARRQMEYVRRLALRLPALGLDLSAQEAEEAARALAEALPLLCSPDLEQVKAWLLGLGYGVKK